MRVFYGAAIQGNRNRSRRHHLHRILIDTIKTVGCEVVSEHTIGSDFDETASLLSKSLGPLPPVGMGRTVFVRNRMIEFIESDISAAIFEVSVPSLGTGIEIAHAYLRPRLGLPELPILALCEKEFWPNNLSSMVRGLTQDAYPRFSVGEFASVEEACALVKDFLCEAKGWGCRRKET
ncbi:MAG: hypothetical protein JXD19_10495 [Deltaproteobacteria bacterium]|nr:hypothetical protein [Deltaproteobacteria bacterium]